MLKRLPENNLSLDNELAEGVHNSSQDLAFALVPAWHLGGAQGSRLGLATSPRFRGCLRVSEGGGWTPNPPSTAAPLCILVSLFYCEGDSSTPQGHGTGCLGPPDFKSWSKGRRTLALRWIWKMPGKESCWLSLSYMTLHGPFSDDRGMVYITDPLLSHVLIIVSMIGRARSLF